jgi:hypothetical protein
MEQIVTWKSPGKIVFFLVSLLLLGGLLFIANLVDPVVHFADPNLEKAIREKIHQPTAPLSRLDLLAITKLDASGRGIRRLEGIESLRRLAVLNLKGNAVEDLSPLSGLGMLSELDLGDNQITNLEAVNFRRILHVPLHSLSLRNNVAKDKNKLSDIRLLSELLQIETLDLQDNNIKDIVPLSHLYSLKDLNLRGNGIQNIEPLAGLTGLISLNIHTNPVETGLDALSHLENLQTLIMRNVPIGKNFQFLGRLKKLQKLNIRNSAIADVSIIAELMQAGALQDHPEAGIHASVDVLEINPLGNGNDPYQSLRRYWDNISYPYPIDLPYHPSVVKPPIFSQHSGFYDDGFYLTISTAEPGGTIYYTLDGAEPSFTPTMEVMGSTQVYTGPLFIQNRAGEPNQLSKIPTDKWKGYIPSTKVFKGTEVRAIVIDNAGNRSNVLTQTYFVDDDMQKRYTLPVISIVTDPKNLFDDEVGIYTFGNLYQNIYPDEPWRNPANFRQRGLKWERPASFQMFSPQGETLITQNIGIRIHGGFSRGFSPKSLRLYARDQYDQQGLFRYNFFPALNGRLDDGTVDTYQTLILRSDGDMTTLFRDALAQSLLERTRLDIQGSQPVIVFINGEYWGIHNIRTRYDEHYFQTHYGITPDELLVLDRGDDIVRLGHYTDQGNNFSNLFALIDENSQSAPAAAHKQLSDKIYQEIAARVDIDNFISYYASEIYFDNIDWPKSNMLTWAKTTGLNSTGPNVPYGSDGKLRWMVADIDSGLLNPQHNNLKRLLVELRNEPSTHIIGSLLENKGFRDRFINQFADYLNTTFREQVVASKIDEFEALYHPEIEEHIQRWGIPESLNTWSKNVDTLRKFALLRPTYQRQHIREYFNLPGTATVKLQVNSLQGTIRINTINIQKGTVGVADPSTWSGVYFQGIPVEITAVPAPGFRFAGWKETGGKEAKLTIVLTEDITLTAEFVKAE